MCSFYLFLALCDVKVRGDIWSFQIHSAQSTYCSNVLFVRGGYQKHVFLKADKAACFRQPVNSGVKSAQPVLKAIVC